MRTTLLAATPLDELFKKCGDLNEDITRLEQLCADLDDDQLSAATHLIRVRVTHLGDLVARRRRAA